MPRTKSKRRLTAKKAPQKIAVDPDLPTDEEWETMVKYGSFIVSDNDEEEHTFSRGDVALVLPEPYVPGDGCEEYEYWVCKIKEIRQRPSTEEVFARVQWYWSGNEVSQLIKSFDASQCSRYERFLSDHFDYVATASFDGTTTVTKYIEGSLEQSFIGEDTFFFRHTLEHRIRKLDPKPASTCICNRRYNPDEDTMHFCPRPGCRRSFHQKCLVNTSLRDADITTRAARLLASSPDSDEQTSLADYCPNIVQVKKGRGKAKAVDVEPEDILDSLPEELVQIAQQPIIKGVNAGGVVGNITSVVRARRLVYKALSGEELPKDWKQQVDLALAKRKFKTLPPLLCPTCEGPI